MVTFGETGIISDKQFKKLIMDELGMSTDDHFRLERVAKFSEAKGNPKTLKVDFVHKNIEERIAMSDKMRDDCIRKISKLMKQEGLDLETAMKYFDNDGDGIISRDELNEGFKRMKVTLSNALIQNVFVILDQNGDNEVNLQEFEAVFSKYFSEGGPVKDVQAEDIQNDLIDEETAKDLAKQMKDEQK